MYLLQCMSDPQIYQTWLFLIDHWSLYATFPPLLIPKFSRFWVSSVTVQAGLCWTWSETQIVGFLMHRLNYHSVVCYSTTEPPSSIILYVNIHVQRILIHRTNDPLHNTVPYSFTPDNEWWCIED